jgi:hypothetical protein
LTKHDLNEKEIKKDFNFLDETMKETEIIKKKLQFVTQSPDLLRMKLIKIHSKKKFSLNLNFAPAIMTRHRQNMSFFYMKTKSLFFTIEIKIYYRQNDQTRFKSILLENP